MSKRVSLVKRNADGQRTDGNFPSFVFNSEILLVDPVVKLALATVQEIETIVLDVKTDHVAAQQSFEHLIGPWEQPENVPGRKGNVKEESQFNENAFFGRLLKMNRDKTDTCDETLPNFAQTALLYIKRDAIIRIDFSVLCG